MSKAKPPPPSVLPPRRLAQLRTGKGLTQHELALLVGVQDSRISEWEARRRNPSLRYLRPLAEALGVTLDEMERAIYPEGAALPPRRGVRTAKV